MLSYSCVSSFSNLFPCGSRALVVEGSPGKSGRKPRKQVSKNPMKRRISLIAIFSFQVGKKEKNIVFFLFPRRAQTSVYCTTIQRKAVNVNANYPVNVHRFSLANRRGPAQFFRSNRTNTPIETTQPYGAPVSGKAADSAYQKLRKKSPRCGEPGGCFANPQARQERQNFGDLARQSVRHPSCTVYKLFPVCDNKIVQDAFLLAGINTVNPDAPIHHCYSALHS